VSKKVILGIVIGSLILAVGVIGGLRILREEEMLPDKALIDSILSWETIVAKVPKLAGYEVEEDIILRGETGKAIPITITSDHPFLWLSVRELGESDPFRAFTVSIALYESEAALQEQIRVIPLAGFEVQENQVTTGFAQRTDPELIPGRAGTVLEAFAAKGRLWVSFVVTTDLEADPFAERAEIEELIELVKERIINISTEF
jgi:hypothetical protein